MYCEGSAYVPFNIILLKTKPHVYLTLLCYKILMYNVLLILRKGGCAVKLLLNNQSKTLENINDLIGYYNSTLQNLTDKYPQLQCKTIALRPHTTWYTSALRRQSRMNN